MDLGDGFDLGFVCCGEGIAVSTMAPGWRLAFGWAIGLFLPLGVLWAVRGDTADLSRLTQFLVLFVLAMIAGKLGKWISGSIWDQTLKSVLDDCALSLILALVAYEASLWMLHHGGGPINPMWAALAGTYLIMLWPIRSR